MPKEYISQIDKIIKKNKKAIAKKIIATTLIEKK